MAFLKTSSSSACRCNKVRQGAWRWNKYTSAAAAAAVPSPRQQREDCRVARRSGCVWDRQSINVAVWRLAATGPGGGVLDKPTTNPGRQSEFDLGKVRRTKEPPQFRVMLHNDDNNRREYVVQVLLKCIPGMTVDIAVNVMNEAHNHGLACVITCAQDDAESYCEKLRANGLISSIEPAGGGGGKDVPE